MARHILARIANALDAAGSAAGANGLNVTLDAQLVADAKAIAAAVKSAGPLQPPRRSRRPRHPLTGPYQALCKVLGMHANDLVGFIH